MKNKTVKKIAKSVFDHFNTLNKTQATVEGDQAEYCEYDESVSKKFKKLINDILSYKENRENVRISYNSSHIGINVDDIKSIKKSSINKFSSKNTEENMLRIDIFKGKGFALNIGYRKETKYKDEGLYDEMINLTKSKIIEINAENFDEIWGIILKDSGILRDNNLDLLNNLLSNG